MLAMKSGPQGHATCRLGDCCFLSENRTADDLGKAGSIHAGEGFAVENEGFTAAAEASPSSPPSALVTDHLLRVSLAVFLMPCCTAHNKHTHAPCGVTLLFWSCQTLLIHPLCCYQHLKANLTSFVCVLCFLFFFSPFEIRFPCNPGWP